MNRTMVMTILLALAIWSCGNAQSELTLELEFVASPDDSIRIYEYIPDNTYIEMATLSAIDTTYTFMPVYDNKRHYYISKGFILSENYWTGYSNIADTLLIAPPVLRWFKKK